MFCFIAFTFIFFLRGPYHHTGVESRCADKKVEDRLEEILYTDFQLCHNRKAPFSLEVGGAVEIDFEIVEIKLLESSLRTAAKSFALTFHFTWTDPHMSWDQTTYPTKELYFTDYNLLWYPLAFIAKDEQINHKWATSMRVQSNGTVHAYSQVTTYTTCDNYIKQHPSIQTICVLTMAFRKDTFSNIKYRPSMQTNLTSHLKGWLLSDGHIDKKTRTTIDKITNTGEIQYWNRYIFLENKNSLEYHLTVYPTFILTFFILMSFFIPAKNNQRFTFNILLLLCVLLLLNSSKSTHSGRSMSIPYIVIYFNLLLYVLSFSFITSIITILLRKQTTPVYPFIRKIFLNPCLLRILFIKHNNTFDQNDVFDDKREKMLALLDQWVSHKAISEGHTDRLTKGDMKRVAMSLERSVMLVVFVYTSCCVFFFGYKIHMW